MDIMLTLLLLYVVHVKSVHIVCVCAQFGDDIFTVLGTSMAMGLKELSIVSLFDHMIFILM